MASNFKRGFEAAVAYLERQGYLVIGEKVQTNHGIIPVLALEMDGEKTTLIHVRVFVTGPGRPSGMKGNPGVETVRTYRKRVRDYQARTNTQDMGVRIDDVHVHVIASDRALLRHHRNVGGDVKDARGK